MFPYRFARLFGLLAGAIVATAHAATTPTDEERAASWEPVIVLTTNAQVFAGDKPGPKIPPGTILYISQRKTEWLLVPRYNSWLNQQHAQPLPAAKAYLDQQIARKPTGVLHHYRAIVLSEMGQSVEALRDFDAAIQLGLTSSNIFLNRGLTWSRADNIDRAMADFDEAIRRDPKNAQAFFNRGVLHSHADRLAAAIQDFDQAIQLDEKYAEAFNNRGVARQAQGEIEAARADFDRALTLRIRYPAALTNRAYLKQLDGDYPGAIADYASALRMAPDAHPTLNDLAWLLATCPDDNIRNGESALAYAERANQLVKDPSDPDYLDTLAAAAAETGDFDRAVKEVEAAIRLAPEEARDEMTARLELYRQKQPYRETPEGPALPAVQPTEPEARP